MMYDFTEEVGEYGNHHEMFHIAQDGLNHDEVQNALETIMGPDGWAADGGIDEHGAWFSTAKENIEMLAMELSQEFPNATVFGQDCWDYEGYIVCFENGQKSKDYSASFSIFDKSFDNPSYYEVELDVTAKNGYQFDAGGGLVYEENIEMMNKFIEDAEGDYEKPDIER